MPERTPLETELLDQIQDMFSQACWTPNGYDHQFLSTYEEAQKILIKHNIINPTSCVRKE